MAITSYFYHSLLRKYIVTFGSIFNNITVKRYNSDGDVIQSIKVPITNSPKTKWFTRITSEPNLEKKASIVLPAMGFEMTSLNYNSSRKKLTIGNYAISATDPSYSKTVYNPVPYDIGFNLYIVAKNQDDLSQIIEQILPFFAPDLNVNIKTMYNNLEISQDTSYVLNSVSPEIVYEGEYGIKNSYICTMGFTCLGNFFGPVIEKPVIKISEVSTFLSSNTEDTDTTLAANTPSLTTTTTPGLLANGSPTTNSSASIDYLEISADDDFGFCHDLS